MKNRLKKIIKRLVPSYSRPYLWLYHHFYRPARFPSLNHLIVRFSQNHPKVNLLMIGAHEGLPADIVYRYIHLNDWSGLLVEPQREAFQLLKKSFRHHPRLRFENVAVSDEPGQRRFYYLESTGPPLPAWANQLSSFHSEVPKAVLADYPPARLVSQDIACTTINHLLDKHQFTQLDFLMIDTEGHDFEILKVLDFQRWRPAFIVYEHCHLSESDQTAAIQLLQQQGYFVYPTAFNTAGFKDEGMAEEYAEYICV
ncbi:MAG: FkbM family methyltransferase [Bacteroidota bacterium]